MSSNSDELPTYEYRFEMACPQCGGSVAAEDSPVKPDVDLVHEVSCYDCGEKWKIAIRIS